ncbi:MAG: alanine racemase [Candidatus Acetothermia bacterium]
MMIGKHKSELDTPVLWVDLDTMEENIRWLVEFFNERDLNWRPHTKGIKTPAIAHKLIEAGAIGVTCAKLSEAEVMASAGIRDILVANQIVGEQKVTRLANLEKWTDLKVAVDNIKNVQRISRIAEAKGVKVPVVVELNTGMNRAGVEPGSAAVDLAKEVDSESHPGVKFAGLMTWEGHAATMEDQVKKERTIREAIGKLISSVEDCEDAGLDVGIVSCGGSQTFKITSTFDEVTEIQAGGAAFTDVAYGKWGVDLNPSLFVSTTVTSRPTSSRGIVDAGKKALDDRVAVPQPKDFEGLRLTGLSAEHGLISIEDECSDLSIGDRVDFIVGYGDNTVFLYDKLYGVRDEKIERAWNIEGRGKLR